MRIKLLAAFLGFASYVVAQNTCCSPTKQFAELGNKESFRAEHQLPRTNAVTEQSGRWINFDTPDEKKGRGYMLYPKKSSDQFLFVFHEWWGLNDNIIREAEEWARIFPNVTVIALDLYDGNVATTREQAAEFMQAADEVRIRSIIQGALIWAGDDAEIATIGWCFGGGWSMQATLMAGEQALGCVIYYGMPEKDPQKLEDLNCKVLGIFAEQDKWINRKVVGEYENAMNEEGKAYETFWFNAAHAFANPSNQKFDEEAAMMAKEKTILFLQELF